MHFSNVLPDLEDDERTGVRGLPHRLGRRVSAAVAAGALVAGATAVLVGSAAGSPPSPLSWLFFAGVVGVAGWGLVAALARPPRRLVFRLVMTAALLLALQLVVAGDLTG